MSETRKSIITENTTESTNKNNRDFSLREKSGGIIGNDDFKKSSSYQLQISFKSFLESYDSSLGEETIKAMEYFLNKYQQVFKREHPKLTPQQWKSLENLLHVEDDEEYYSDYLTFEEIKPMIDKYFQIRFKGNEKGGCNYSILHFNSNRVKLYRYYEEAH